MIKIKTEDAKQIMNLTDIVDAKLTEALDRTGEVGGMVNIDAPELVRDAKVKNACIRTIVEKAEDASAKAGDINSTASEESSSTLLQ